MITLTLLHPVQATPVQSWTFEHESIVRIGRAVDNHVVLYSAVVSRHHVELRRNGLHWEVVNLGTNGTYLDGKRVQQASLNDGGILRLARSGPNIQIRIGPSSQPPPPNARMDTIPEQYVDPSKMTVGGVSTEVETRTQSATQIHEQKDVEGESDPGFHVVGQLPLEFLGEYQNTCTHPQAGPLLVFCPDCGQPLRPLEQIGPYQVFQAMGSDHTCLAWRAGRMVVLKSLPETAAVANFANFRHQARQLCRLDHPHLPKFYEAFSVNGQPYLSTERIYGPTLEAWVSDYGPLSLAEVCHALRPLCQLLDQLHQEHPPIVHQQIHPRQLVRPLGSQNHDHWQLIGWGHVPIISGDAGTLLANTGYLAPELQAGQPQPESDLFALGATLVYLLTGYDPSAYVRWGVKEYRMYAEDIPRMSLPIAEIVNALTHPNPDERPKSALKTLERLEALI